MAGLHKIEIGLGTKFQHKFSAWFSHNFMLSGKAQNVHFIMSNIYIGLRIKKMNNNYMNKKIIFWWSLWTMALIWDKYWKLVSAVINCKMHTVKQFKS